MKFKNIISVIILTILFSSCNDSLEENFYSGSSIDLLVSTESGMESLIGACYIPMKVWYGKEYGWDLTTVGTDCWTYAGDADDMKNMATFTSNFNNSWPGRLGAVWSEFYKGLNTCNTALEYLPRSALSDELKVIREGEIRFMRAFITWHIVETWGNVVYYTEPITTPEYEMHRSEVDKFYSQIFSDLDIAVENLTPGLNSTDYGRAHQYAALALRARAHLYWASEYMSGNSFDGKTYPAINGIDHWQQAIDDAKAVIANSSYELYDNFSDVWEMENNASADENTENIWAVNYSQSEYAAINLDPDEFEYLRTTDPKPLSEREGGCHGHMMFGMRWFAVGGTSTVLIKEDGSGITETEPTRPFCRYMPTKYLIDLFNTDVDERFYGTFNTVFYANNPDSAKYPVWETSEILANGNTENIDAALVGKRVLNMGDTAFVLYKDNIPDDALYTRTISGIPWYISKNGHFYCLDAGRMYNADGTINENNTNERRTYFDMQKWYDRTRPNNDVEGSQRGQRDFIVFRLPEMYFIVAEASLAKSNSAEAYNYLKILADKRSVDGNGEALLQTYGVNSNADVNIDFILDEKAREFAGEQQRWYDLKRTGKTLERIRAYNPDASQNIEEKHLVRPIPQIELDAIENKDDYQQGFGIY